MRAKPPAGIGTLALVLLLLASCLKADGKQLPVMTLENIPFLDNMNSESVITLRKRPPGYEPATTEVEWEPIFRSNLFRDLRRYQNKISQGQALTLTGLAYQLELLKQSNRWHHRPYIAISRHALYKFLINADGHVSSSRMGHIMQTNSVILQQRSLWIEYYYRSLQPGVHVLEYSPEDVLTLLEKYQDPQMDGELRRLANASQHFCAKYLTIDGKIRYTVRALHEYNRLFGSVLATFARELRGLGAFKGWNRTPTPTSTSASKWGRKALGAVASSSGALEASHVPEASAVFAPPSPPSVGFEPRASAAAGSEQVAAAASKEHPVWPNIDNRVGDADEDDDDEEEDGDDVDGGDDARSHYHSPSGGRGHLEGSGTGYDFGADVTKRDIFSTSVSVSSHHSGDSGARVLLLSPYSRPSRRKGRRGRGSGEEVDSRLVRWLDAEDFRTLLRQLRGSRK
ncbi:hypothetical protein VOLCADRAFT_92043 [Volvox carteri f. nagariensis]|uniref:Glycosyl transferase CAP10 domain-containing protein n=1 Tax=Volvox carteri f. nagariensis TaxID=3068 RepID=D8TYY7_VOLCA|nr:uncharacterized protein VOLCADRAFT_92043 [Volvox carteri f. nagariensis]EFJ47299.1 hypothetical protein VOLCADRAFT_92043 [Volvox carteri f. nagariensis]|eukprot:XP_002951488.1 hypothetical protein VOLCADRAFT_92043 [Volvox carteri f. nagariensis]